jgi:SagB-type dehydrogenase family enzyme
MMKIKKLPAVKYKGELSLEEVILRRRSRRDFNPKFILSLSDISQILWAAAGITSSFAGLRTTPSAGATFPLEIYLISQRVEDLNPGNYHYLPSDHALELVKEGDLGEDLAAAALGQDFIAKAAANIVITAEYKRTTWRYGKRGEMYVHMEAGHAGENIYLQAEALGLKTVAIGAFRESEVSPILDLSNKLIPIYIFPIGG